MSSLLKPSSSKRVLFFVLADLILSLGTLYLAYLLRFNYEIPKQFLDNFWIIFGFLVSLKIVALYLLKVYFAVWRFFALSEAKSIFWAHAIAYALFAILYHLLHDIFESFPRSVLLIDFFISLFALGLLRLSKRLIAERDKKQRLNPTLIIGVGSQTATVIKNALSGTIEYYPVAILATGEQHNAVHSYISNIKVFGIAELESVVTQRGVVAAILTEEFEPTMLREIVDRLNLCGVYEIKQFKLLGSDEKLESLSIEDLLARKPKDLDINAIGQFISGKSVLITGAGGSIGSEIALQCLEFGARSLTLVDNSEYNLYTIGEKIPNAKLVLLSVTQKEELLRLFGEIKPQIVIHAAAYKHVPICEANQHAAITNNIIGTKNLIDCAILHAVQKVVIISTDKAVRPTNVMGATKRVTELYANNVESGGTEIVAVRFGNVLGSSGSVIPKFKSQIEAGGPLTVTHPEITRYFMLIGEACRLVLQTAAIARGGELFVLDMGEPVKIVDLARQMIRLYGKEGRVEIVYSGLRPGEKLYEELLIDESEKETQYSSIFIARPTPYDIKKLEIDIETLLLSDDKVSALRAIVPEFNHIP